MNVSHINGVTQVNREIFRVPENTENRVCDLMGENMVGHAGMQLQWHCGMGSV